MQETVCTVEGTGGKRFVTGFHLPGGVVAFTFSRDPHLFHQTALSAESALRSIREFTATSSSATECPAKASQAYSAEVLPNMCFAAGPILRQPDHAKQYL